VLSNTNALEVPGLRDLTSDRIVRRGGDGKTELARQEGRVLGLTNDTVDALRALETFKPSQGWSLFRRPATLIRRETVHMAENVVDATGERRSTVRKVLCGSRGSGKSVLLLQAQAMALLKGAIVIHLPEGRDMVNAHTAYHPLQTPEGTIYVQPQYTAQLLGNLARANQPVLSKLRLRQQHRLPVPVQANMSLDRFAELGAKDSDLAWPIWEALWSELTAPSQAEGEGQQRPPVLISLDGLDHVMRQSAYLDAEAKPVHAHSLALVRDFMRLLNGETALPNGGMVVAATCASNKAAAPTLDHMLKVATTQEGQEAPRWDPYVAKDERVEKTMKDVQVTKLLGLSKDEARGVMEYYAHSGMLRNGVTNLLTSEQWSLAGQGIVGELEKGAVRARF